MVDMVTETWNGSSS